MTGWDFSSAAPDDPQGSALADLRTDRPTPARMYDYFLGGKDNFDVDREAAAKVDAALGRTVTYDVVWENRRFLQRATRWLAGAGIDQFLDIGTGLPTQGNVHEIAKQVVAAPRVVYVDNDPIVAAHGRALLASDHTTTIITADAREPAGILTHPDLPALLDLSRPVAVLLVALFHFIQDKENPAGLLAEFMAAVPSGSYLVLSHLTTDGPPAEGVARTEAAYQNATSPMTFRPRATIASYFDGLDLVEPGLVRPWQWHPGDDDSPRTDWLYAGVARKP
ncbi:SAM-dependent methyltransferase [Frankia sp. AgB1.9]|uniref:SAM-dependent methyltransferase n=1 Tax=unclassified Frankia TaxID=2632575 RepID=UPI00193120AB|nr:MULTISPECIES: SAM-dependent methyltransferase [unclassified Frankia]MBL7489692.1 SAM-dependent methyltransferase [Frankia sp. AgW1.1]MBL7548456.1 SAM-dependent methyltransferase [Frankia sp. AgB1.9]MBL7621346.1 SAM-dependent methyltransferase [Frankia sp. AgB1.8]